MRDKHSEFEAKGLQILVVGQATPDDLSRFLQGRDLPFELLCDLGQKTYRAYGLLRGNPWTVTLAPAVVAAGLAARREGHRIRKIVGDVMQLPGSFVIVEGRVVYAHRGRLSSDIAPPDELLAALLVLPH